MNKKLKIVILVVVVIIAGFFIFSLTQKNVPAPTQSGLSSTGVALGGATAKQDATSLAGLDDFSAALANIRSVSIDTSIFNDPAYKTLQDNKISLGTEVIGRNNPFAPVGTDVEAQVFPTSIPATEVVSSNGASISTGTPTKIQKTTVTLAAQASLDPGTTATIVFAYGDTDALGSVTTPIKIKASGPVTFPLKKLIAGTQYYVQATMTLPDGTTTVGDIISFNTL